MRIARFFRTTAFRLALLYAALFSTSVLALFVFIYGTTTVLLERQRQTAIFAEGAGLTDTYGQIGLSGLASEILARTQPDRVGDNIYLLAGPDLRRLAGNLSGWPATVQRDGAWLSFPIERRQSGEREQNRSRALHIVLPGGYHLLVGQDTRAEERFQAAMIEVFAWSLAVVLCLGIGGGLVMSRRMLRRIESINQVAERIVEGDVTRRIPIGAGHDELDRLAANLNRMLDEIEHLMGSLRSVTTGIAHDLRSPLTRLRGQLEQALSEGGPRERHEMIERALGEADQLLATFNALLSIADAEAGAGRASLAPLDLAPLARDVADLYQPFAEERGISLETAVAGPLRIAGNRHLLFQAVANLLDNAVKYAPPGGRIVLALRATSGGPEISVADNGPGIPVHERERVLERFVRLDASRTTPGSGLGLSLVAAIAQMHGASLRLEDNDPGLVAMIRFRPLPAEIPEAAAA